MRAVFMLLVLAIGSNTGAQDAASVFAKAKGAVVTVTTPTGSGTGFIIGGTHVVTCYHVVKGEAISGVRISLAGVHVTSLQAFNEEADIAIFRLSGKAPKSLSLHTSGVLNPGSKVFAIGTPLGFLSHTITEGIVSGVRRTDHVQLLQITAAVSPGSSGSPVLDSSGLVVGMVTGSIKEGQALNFAVSASDIRRVQSGGVRAAAAVKAPPSRTEAWPKGNARLAGLASKLGSKELGDEASRKIAKEGPKAVPFLIAAFRVFNDDKRAMMRATDALVAIGKPAVVPLIPLLRDRDADVRIWATIALGDIKDARAVDPLIPLLRDKDEVRFWAAEALGQIKDARAVAPLILALSDSDGYRRDSPARALVAIGKPAVEPLIRALSDNNEDVRSSAAEALGQIKDARAVGPLIRALSDNGVLVSFWAAEALEKIGKPAVESLIGVLSDSEAKVRAYAASALGEIKDSRAVEPLIGVLSDSEARVRSNAADALGQIKDVRAVEPLIRALADRDMDIRVQSISALQEIGQPTVEPLIRALSDSNKDIRSGAAITLGGSKDVRAVEPLIRALTDGESNVRGIAASMLGKIKDARALEPLHRLLSDPDGFVRTRAAEAIKKIKGDEAAVEESSGSLSCK